jgi:hypothetical protein
VNSLICSRHGLGVEVAGDGVLGERRRAEHLRLGGQHQLLADGERGEHPAHPQARENVLENEPR